MVRNIVIFGGSSHSALTKAVCDRLSIDQGRAMFSSFKCGETRVEIQESVRGKDVYIIQTASSGGGEAAGSQNSLKTNDLFLELLISISACKTASAATVTAVCPMFFYSRQSDIPYNKSGAPLFKASMRPPKDVVNGAGDGSHYTFESVPSTPHPEKFETNGFTNGFHHMQKSMSRTNLDEIESSPTSFQARFNLYKDKEKPEYFNRQVKMGNDSPSNGIIDQDFATAVTADQNNSKEDFKPRPGYKEWVAQAGTLVADLLTCAGADHVITMDLHDAQYQGFFCGIGGTTTSDNLYSRPILKKYIQHNIDYKNGVIVSPDAGGAKRATAIADALGINFALIHKERRVDRKNATMMLVGDVAGKIAIMIDDIADTSNTITRAALLLKRERATKVFAILTHGVLSGNAISRINSCVALDKLVVTNTIDQSENCRRCPKLEVLDVSHIFSEAIRRVHFGESLSVLFQYD